MTSELVFLLTSIFGIAGILLGKHIGYSEGYEDGFMDGHNEAMTKITAMNNVRVIPKPISYDDYDDRF